MKTLQKTKSLPTTTAVMAVPHDTIPPGGEAGTSVVVPQWTKNTFTLDSNGMISGILEQTSQVVFQSDSSSLPVWYPPYPSGNIYLTFDEIIALPSADPFFGELWALANQKLAESQAPAPM